jgi:hypothetical protein
MLIWQVERNELFGHPKSFGESPEEQGDISAGNSRVIRSTLSSWFMTSLLYFLTC